eukprot:Hpha_TRINITY_DN19275_c0_g1::TRINITY_DN19275_c0_g1_i1::g.194344::m.194344/K08193/SLC17A; MFS transporter, ACS family, solute carrier family 17 (sodium-dependent inorganic phosphate cotransporter), other
MNAQGEVIKKCSGRQPLCEKRWLMVFMCSLNTFVAYCDRVNISVAVLAMRVEMGWTTLEQTRVLGSFFWGYAVSQLLGTHFALRYGGKAVLLAVTFTWSILTIATPFLARTGPLFGLVVARVLLGLAEGCCFPTIFHILGGWVRGQERARSVALAISGGHVGTVTAFVVSPLLMEHMEWGSVFYLFGVLGLLWCLLWNFLAEDPPPEGEEHDTRTPQGLQWSGVLTVLRSRSCQAIFVAHSAWTFGFFIAVAWVPTYFHSLGIGSTSLGAAALPYLLQAIIGNIAGLFSDWLIVKGVPRLTVRRMMSTAAFTNSVVCMLSLGLIPHLSGLQKVSLLVIGVGGGGFVLPGFEANKLDVVQPHLVGTVQGISNTFACLVGAVGVPVAGHLRDSLGNFDAVFLAIACVHAVGGIVYVLMSGDGQPPSRRDSEYTDTAPDGGA